LRGKHRPRGILSATVFVKARQTSGATGNDERPHGDLVAGELEGEMRDVAGHEGCGPAWLDQPGGDEDDDTGGVRVR
jgi:hypothetical protein